MQRMDVGFTRLYSQLEAMDQRLSYLHRFTDKVDMLETSVRLLENHVLAWPHSLSPTSSLSSSSLHSSALTCTASNR